jgi:hypothetical protein
MVNVPEMPVRNYQINEFRIGEAMLSQQAGNSLKARYYRTFAEKTASGFAARGLR